MNGWRDCDTATTEMDLKSIMLNNNQPEQEKFRWSLLYVKSVKENTTTKQTDRENRFVVNRGRSGRERN